jgi:hypothetical protein
MRKSPAEAGDRKKGAAVKIAGRATTAPWTDGVKDASCQCEIWRTAADVVRLTVAIDDPKDVVVYFTVEEASKLEQALREALAALPSRRKWVG